MSSSLPEKELIKATIIRLLEKANRHPELTPRILRTKIEQKLKLADGTLNSKKYYIKKVALAWWTGEEQLSGAKKEEQLHVSEPSLAMKRLTKLANVAGKIPQALKGLSNLSDEEKVTTLRQR
jgi:hypothetical protein